MKKPVLILGAGGHAKILIDIINESYEYYVAAVIGQENENVDYLMGYKVLKGDKYLEEFKLKGISNVAIGVGGYRDNKKRRQIFNSLIDKGYDIVNLIHPASTISSSVKLGVGVVIFAGVILNAEVEIGDNVVVATGSTIDHESIIESHTLISAGVTVGAGTNIGEGSLLALGSKVISRVTIGKDALIAAGSVVVADVEKEALIIGVPGKPKNR